MRKLLLTLKIFSSYNPPHQLGKQRSTSFNREEGIPLPAPLATKPPRLDLISITLHLYRLSLSAEPSTSKIPLYKGHDTSLSQIYSPAPKIPL
jgi:hypothetical protein